MSQKEMFKTMSETSGESQAAIERVMAAFAGYVTGQLQAGNEVVIPYGIGKLKPKRREERQGRNPQTGEAITIAAHNVVVFKAAIVCLLWLDLRLIIIHYYR